MGNKTELRISQLGIEQDQGEYFCNATNEIGARVETIHLRVRGRYAAVWPFLGIVAEVIVLVAIIFIYEKRRKPDEISDGKLITLFFYVYVCIMVQEYWYILFIIRTDPGNHTGKFQTDTENLLKNQHFQDILQLTQYF